MKSAGRTQNPNRRKIITYYWLILALGLDKFIHMRAVLMKKIETYLDLLFSPQLSPQSKSRQISTATTIEESFPHTAGDAANLDAWTA